MSYITACEGVPVDKWEYCEVVNWIGQVVIRRLVVGGNGWDERKVSAPNVNNMAIALASLGNDGWEVVVLDPDLIRTKLQHGSTYTGANAVSTAFLKRRVG
jgi:hypothetical protein